MPVDLISKIAEKARASSMRIPAPNNSDLIVSLPVSSVKPHPKNQTYFKDLDRTMKDKLMEDMKNNGQINPIIVNKNKDSTYTVLAGHQRLIAARRLNWIHIKAIVLEVDDLQAEMLLIRDNLFRRHMGGMELARALDAYSKLSDNQTPKSIRQIANETGENRNTVHFYMKLNNLIPELQDLINQKKLSPTAAQVFTSMDIEEQRNVFTALGDSIIGMKKRDIEEELSQRFSSKITELELQNKATKDIQTGLISELKRKDDDIEKYISELKIYSTKSEELSLKVQAYDTSEVTRDSLSKLELVNSILSSLNYVTPEIPKSKLYEFSALQCLSEKSTSIIENLSTWRDNIDNIINMKSTE